MNTKRKSVADKKIIIIVSKASNLGRLRKTTLKEFIKKYRTGIYATASIPADVLEKELKLGATEILWIDVTGGGTSKRHINMSPKSLTSLSIAITQALDTGKFNFFVLDSISPLLLYNDAVTVERFISYIINKLRHLELPGAILVGEGEDTLKVVHEIEASCDETVTQ